MATDSTKNTTVHEEIRKSNPGDASDIVEAFSNEYEEYYGKFVDVDELEAFLRVMKDELEDVEIDEIPEDWSIEDWESDKDPEIVQTVEDVNGDFIGVGAVKLQENLAELGSTIIRQDCRGLRSERTGRTVYDELFADRLGTAASMVEDDEDPIDIVYTQLLADKSASTQHVADKHDFAVTGVYDKKFPPAYEGKGRVTVVDMIWTDSNIENRQEDVYVPETAEDIVRASINNINSKRSSELEPITRRLNSGNVDHRDRRYKVKPKTVGDPMNFAEIEIVEDEEGDYTWNDVLNEIGEAQSEIQESEKDEDYWVGLTLDANSPFLPTAAEEFEEMGFEYAGFNPGKIDTGEEERDALEMQYRPSKDKYRKQFIDEAVDFIETAGIEHGKSEASTDYEKSDVVEI